ncbi:MAG: hypothetical protein L3J12_01230 [Spirochaetales bacterium]|nr:hypothetical protein [Spirochaetales bacterium]
MKNKKILFTLAEDELKSNDSTFAVKYSVDEEDCFDFSTGLKNLDHSVYFVNWKDLDFNKREFSRMFDDNTKSFIEPLSIDEMDLIFIYKQEGFLFDIPKFYSMLDIFDSTSALKINDTKTIKKNISKEYLMDLTEAGISSVPTYYINDAVLKRIDKGEEFVIKPKIGERGTSQKKISSLDELDSFDNLDDYLAQEFSPDIRNGERSLVFLGKEYSHAVIKKPNPEDLNEYRCNESLGGTVAVYDPPEKELSFCNSILNYWESSGYPVHFSRIDLIVSDSGNPSVLEAELLNPSIYANYSGIGKEFGNKIAGYFNSQLEFVKK